MRRLTIDSRSGAGFYVCGANQDGIGGGSFKKLGICTLGGGSGSAGRTCTVGPHEAVRSALSASKAADGQYEKFCEALDIIAMLAHKYRMNSPERVVETYPDKRAKALDWLRDNGFCWDCEAHDPFGDCLS